MQATPFMAGASYSQMSDITSPEESMALVSTIGRRAGSGRNVLMLWAVVAIILILWLLGFIGSIGGSLIHLLLVVALVVIVFQLLTGRRAV